MSQKSILAILALMLAFGLIEPLELLIVSVSSENSAFSGEQPDSELEAALSAAKKTRKSATSSRTKLSSKTETTNKSTSRTKTPTKSKTSAKLSTKSKSSSARNSTPAENDDLILPKIDVRLVKTEAELFAAVADPSVAGITLTSDIVTVANLEISRNVTIDLNNFNLTSLKENIRIIDIKYGEVLITGKGSIVAYGPGGAAVRVKGATTADNANYSHVIIDRDVTLFAPNYYGLFVTPNFNAAYGVTVDFYGSMIAQDGICINGSIQGTGDNAPVINLLDGSEITVDENSGTALYAAGFGIWNLHHVKIDAATGIGIKSGVLNLHDSIIKTTGTFDAPTGWDHGILGVGAVIQIEDNSDYAGNIHIAIDGGEYHSENSHTFVEYGDLDAPYSLQSFEIKSGNFSGQLGVFYGIASSDDPNTATAVYGGTFSDDITSYLAIEHHLDLDEHGYVVIDEQELYRQGIEAHLAQTRSRLQDLIDLARLYINGNYTKGDLGAWRPRVKTNLTTLKRMLKLAEKANHPKSTLEKLESAIRSLDKAIKNLEGIGDDMRTEILATVAAIDSINPSDYTSYSYEQLIEAVNSARLELDRPDSTLEELYSILIDLEINIDLLEENTNEIHDDSLRSATPPVIQAPPVSMLAAPVSDQVSSTTTPAALAPIPDSEDDPDFIDIFRQLGASTILVILNETGPLPSQPALAKPLAQPIISELDFVRPEMPIHEAQPISEISPSLNSAENAPKILPLPESARSTSEPTAFSGMIKFTQPEMLLANLQSPNTYPTPSQPSYANDAAYIEAKTNLLTILSAVDNLAISDYEPVAVEQFGELQVAIAKAKSALVKPFVAPESILEIMEEIQVATTGLKSHSEEIPEEANPSVMTAEATSEAAFERAPAMTSETAPETTPELASPSVDWTPLREVITDVSAIEPTAYTPQTYAKMLSELQRAKSLLTFPGTTQDMIEDIVFDINLAILELEPISSSYALANSEYLTDTSFVNPDLATTETPATCTPIDSSSLAPAESSSMTQYVSAEPAPTSINLVSDTEDDEITPSFLMSMMAGAYAGLATYRRSRLAAKKRRLS